MNIVREGYDLDLAPVGDDTTHLVEMLYSEAEQIGGITEIQEFASGTIHNGWVVPEAWMIQEACISKNGIRVFSSDNPLAVWACSESFHGEMGLGQFEDHVVYSETLPTATLWHWKKWYSPEACKWGFSVPYSRFLQWEPGTYQIDLETFTLPNQMLVFDWTLPGDKEQTIVINAHNCHPKQANDNLSGCQVGWDVMCELAKRRRRLYTYKLLICPELLGVVFWLSQEPANIVAAILLKSVGNMSDLKTQLSFSGGSDLDRLLLHIYTQKNAIDILYGFRQLYGNDEIAFESMDIPAITLTRYPFREYHTSLDTPVRLDNELMRYTVQSVLALISANEENVKLRSTHRGLPRLSHLGLYKRISDPTSRFDHTHQDKLWHLLASRMPMYWNYERDILSLAEDHGLPFEDVLTYMKQARDAGIVEFLPR